MSSQINLSEASLTDSQKDLIKQKKELSKNAQEELEEWSPDAKTSIPSKDRIQVIDFFSGCGGMSLGFDAVSRFKPSYDVIGGCDIDEDAVESFQENHDAKGIKQDIRELTEDEKLREFLDNIPAYDEEDKTLLIGCAPCQGFTAHRKKNWEEKDERNTLVEVFAEIAVKIDPDVIVMENVPEMLSEKYWHYFESVKETLEAADYTVKASIYNSARFGAPQERFRSIIVAMKDDFGLAPPMYERSEFRTVRDAIGDLPEVEPGEKLEDYPFHKCANHRKSTLETIEAVPKDGGDRPEGVGPSSGYADVYGRLYWDKPSITITRYARNPASGRFVHPEQNRGLTMREAARLQTFPDKFEFSGSFDSVFKQIGEAVPPMLATSIAASILIDIRTDYEKLEISPPDGHLPVRKPVSSSYSSVISGIKNGE